MTTEETRVEPSARIPGQAEAEDYYHRWEVTWADPTPDSLASMLHPESWVQYYSVMPERLDRDGLREWHARMFERLPDMRAYGRTWGWDGKQMYIEWIQVATVDGSEVRWPGIDLFGLRDGLRIELRTYLDVTPVREALAAAESA